MRKYLLIVFMLLMSGTAGAQDISLPKPQITGGKPLMDVIAARRTGRSFSARQPDEQTLSNLLWSAWGISSSDGKRTIPTARNKQNLNIYILRPDGAYLYNAAANRLEKVTGEDLRPLTDGGQGFPQTAPLTLIYTAQEDYSAALHAGSAYQNVGLFCASFGLNNVVRGMIDREALSRKLKLPEGHVVLISQIVGYPQ